jgi:AraC-like DNA-binding protein
MAAVPIPVIESQAIEDIDAMAGAIAGGLCAEYVQLEGRRFTGRWTVARLPHMVLQKGREDIAIVRRMRAAAGFWSFIVPTAVGDGARWDARAVAPDDLLVCAPGAECFAFDPAGTEFAVVSVGERHSLVSAARPLLSPGERSAMIAQRGREARTLRQHLADLLRTDDAYDRTICRFDGLAGAVISFDLDRSLRSARPAARQSEASVARRHVVACAEAFFRRHLGEPISIAHVSSVAGVSERSLRNAFCGVYTTSPKRYLRLWQLHQVRHALRASTGAGDTVTDVATLHGFFELGRFAGEYKALFGEAPSQTLQKARAT